MSTSYHAWDIAKASAKAKESNEAVSLTRPDGSPSGLVVTAEGDVRRAILKPKGKAARKQFKALRRQISQLDPKVAGTAINILKRKAIALCKEGVR